VDFGSPYRADVRTQRWDAFVLLSTNEVLRPMLVFKKGVVPENSIITTIHTEDSFDPVLCPWAVCMELTVNGLRWDVLLLSASLLRFIPVLRQV
jgi:hypothetical protein